MSPTQNFELEKPVFSIPPPALEPEGYSVSWLHKVDVCSFLVCQPH